MSVDTEYIQELLMEIGWDKGISIPMANDENKALCDELSAMKRQNIIDKHKAAATQDKILVIEEHKRNARIERSNCEAIVDALKHDIETEIHLRKIKERELGRIKQDITKVHEKTKDIITKRNMYENRNYTTSMELEAIKTDMQWDQQDLEKYLAECNHQEDLSKYLSQYALEDSSRSAVLNHEISELIDKRIKIRKKLDESVIETKILQVELDKTAEIYRQVHGSRREVIDRWNQTIKKLQMRDEDIKKVSNDLNDHREKLREFEVELEEKKSLYKTIDTDNTDIEKKIFRIDREIAHMTSDHQDLMKNQENIRREYEFLKSQIERTARETEVARAVIKEIRAKREHEIIRLNDLSERVKKTMDRYDIIQKLAYSSDQILTFTEQLLKEEEMYLDALKNEMARLRDNQYKVATSFTEQRTIHRNKQADIHTNRATLRNLLSRKAKCEVDLLQLDELIYKTELNIQNWEHRIATLEGDNTCFELQKELKLKISYLTEDLEALEKVVKQLNDMIKQFDNESGNLRLKIERLKKLKQLEEDKIVAEDISIDNSRRQLNKTKKLREEDLIYRNMEKFHLTQLESRCKDIMNKVTDLEVHRQHITGIGYERRVEIKYHQDIMKKDLILLEREKSDIYRQWMELQGKLKKTKSRFEILSNDENKDALIGLKATVEAAIAKEELQNYGDTLDIKLRKSEKEIRALENTVVLLNTCNENFRYTNTKVAPSSEEVQSKLQAESDLADEQKLYSVKRFEMRLILKDLEKVKHRLISDEAVQKKLLDKIEEIKLATQKKQDDVAKLEEKLKRAENVYINMRKAVSNNIFDLADIEVKVQNYLNELHVAELCQILYKGYTEIWNDSAKNYLENAEIEIPRQYRVNAAPASNRASVNLNNQNSARSTTQNKPLQMSVVNLTSAISLDGIGTNRNNAGNKKSSISLSSLHSSASNNSSVSNSSRSSVKMRLKESGLRLPPSSGSKE